jgi:glycine dehydrogenase subunit 1
MALLGEAGFTGLAAVNHAAAVALAERLAEVPGVRLETEQFFNEFTLKLPKPAHDVVEALARKGILGGVPGARLWPGEKTLADRLIVAATEMTSDEDIDAYAVALREVLS